jgi:hypothetical protein
MKRRWAVVEAPSVSIEIKLSAVTVLLLAGAKVSMSPAAELAVATVIVPIELPAAFFTVMVASAVPIAPSRTVITLVIVPAYGVGTYTVSAVEISLITAVRGTSIEVQEPEPEPLATYTWLATADATPLGSWRSDPVRVECGDDICIPKEGRGQPKLAPS